MVLLAALVVFNLIIVRSLWLDDGLSKAQKLAQGLLIWLLPLFGGSIVLAMQGQNHSRAEMTSLAPFPFYLVGYVDRPHKSSTDHYVIDAKDLSEGVCGDGDSD